MCPEIRINEMHVGVGGGGGSSLELIGDDAVSGIKT